jgi:hypothetical protein
MARKMGVDHSSDSVLQRVILALWATLVFLRVAVESEAVRTESMRVLMDEEMWSSSSVK